MWMRHGISDNFSNSSGAFRHIHQFATTSLVTACVTYQVESYQSDICCDIWLCRPYWQPCWTNNHCSFNRLSNRVVQPVWQPAVYTIQPVVKLVVKRVWQPVECFYTRYNRSYRVYRHLPGCQTALR